jgi:hypothetical protein
MTTVERRVIGRIISIRPIATVIGVFVAAILAVCFATSASATTTVPTLMNFQGKVSTSSGATVVDGTYNMRLRIFNASTGGTLQWSEDRLISAGQGVQVKNGMFSVQLGSVTSLPASLFVQPSLHFEVELPTPATATSTSPSWTEGAMTPRNRLATSAYAYNADTLDGRNSTEFALLAGANAFTQAQTIDVANTAALSVKNGSGINVLNVDTTTSTIVVGSASNGVSLSPNGVAFSGTARGTKTVTLVPEYQGVTFRGDGTNNTGSLSSDFCSATTGGLAINTAACTVAADEHNYYEWANTQATAQDYDLFIRYQLPQDYDTGSMTNLTFTANGTTANEAATLTVYRGATQCSTTGDIVTGANTWFIGTVASPLGSCVPTAGSYITFKIQLAAAQNNKARSGEISYTYRSRN